MSWTLYLSKERKSEICTAAFIIPFPPISFQHFYFTWRMFLLCHHALQFFWVFLFLRRKLKRTCILFYFTFSFWDLVKQFVMCSFFRQREIKKKEDNFLLSQIFGESEKGKRLDAFSHSIIGKLIFCFHLVRDTIAN